MNIRNLSRWETEWRKLAQRARDDAQAKGFNSLQHEAIPLALMHSEISEALEAYRMGNPESKAIPGWGQVEEELADLIIRIMDHGDARDYDLPGAVLAKMAYNANRPHKHGGKAY